MLPFQIYDQNAPRDKGIIPIIGTYDTEKECLEHIKKLHPEKKITTESPPFGDGKLVFVNGDYSYFVG